LTAIAGGSQRVSVIDPLLFFCPESACRMRLGDTVFYNDDDHLSASGALAFFAAWTGKKGLIPE
jgi:hypothetical protein